MSSKPTSDRILLELKNISAYYGKVSALEDISISVPEGTIVSLIGANGAGKSTIFKIVSGVMYSISGSIRFKGEKIDRLPPHERTKRGIAYVPEGRRLFTKMTVLENLKMGGYTRKDGKKKTEAMERGFRHFPVLKVRVKQLAGTLSGGEQQMLAIARGLMVEPKLIILDEPSIGLSPIVTTQIGTVITEINKEETTVLLAEQNARLALKLCNHAYVLETGHIVLEGRPEDLMQEQKIVSAYLSA